MKRLLLVIAALILSVDIWACTTAVVNETSMPDDNCTGVASVQRYMRSMALIPRAKERTMKNTINMVVVTVNGLLKGYRLWLLKDLRFKSLRSGQFYALGEGDEFGDGELLGAFAKEGLIDLLNGKIG